MEAFVRAYHVIAVFAVLVIGLGAKQLFFPATDAQADMQATRSHSMNVLQIHADYPNIKTLPVQKVNDMTFVFSSD
jgi:hypothetical protein